MITIDGFCRIPAMSDNNEGKVSPIGEISSTSESFSRNKQYYRGNADDVELVVFDSSDGAAAYELPLEHINTITEILQWVFDKSITSTFTSSADSARSLVQANFSNLVSDVTITAMELLDGTYYPKYISFELQGSEENKVSVWFSDPTFRYQYGGFEFISVSPIAKVDDFHKGMSGVVESLSEFSISKHNSDISASAGEYPYTTFKTKPYTWHDREDASQTLETYWTVIIYGAAGNNPSRIKRALQDHILANSIYPRTEWVKVFPEIFTSTEFTIIPLWENTGAVNLTDRSSTYSPIIPYEEFKTKANWFFETIEDNDSVDINNLNDRYLDFMPIHYKSISALMISGEANPPGFQKFTDIYPGYSNIPSNSGEMSRIPDKASNFIIMLMTCMGYAESLYGFEVVDNDFSVLIQNGHAFYVFEDLKVEYRILIHPDAQSDYVG